MCVGDERIVEFPERVRGGARRGFGGGRAEGRAQGRAESCDEHAKACSLDATDYCHVRPYIQTSCTCIHTCNYHT